MTRLAKRSSKRVRTTPHPTGKRRAAKMQTDATLRAENRALKKSVKALMDRVEKAVDEQGSAFSWFQAAASLKRQFASEPNNMSS